MRPEQQNCGQQNGHLDEHQETERDNDAEETSRSMAFVPAGVRP